MDQLTTAVQNLSLERRHLVADLIAGLTFAVVNVPQAMAHALLATVNPVLGIFTLMVAAPVGAIFTGSVYMNVSTTAALSVAVGAGLADIPASQRVEALVVLTLLVGVIQLLAGLFRLGFLIRFVSNAVMTGFLNGVAVLIILGQLSDLTGYKSAFSNRVAQALDLLLRIGQINVPTTIIGGVALALFVLLLLTPLRRFAFIIAIAVATVSLVLLTLPALSTKAYFAAVPAVGHIAAIPRSIPQLALPRMNLIASLLLPAISVAIIGLIQGAGVSQGTPNPDGKYPNVSRDFFGQLFVAVIVLLAAPLVERVPMPALAALLIVAGCQGLRLPQAGIVWKTGRVSATVMIVTFIATLLVGLQYAILFGMALSIVLHVFRQSNKVVVIQWVLQPGGFPLERRPPKKAPSNDLTILHVYGSLFFAAAKNMEEMLPDVEDTNHAVVAITLRGRVEVCSTFLTVLQRYAQALRACDSKLMLVGIDPAVRDQLAKTGVLNIIGEENVFLATPQVGVALNQAVAAATAWLDQHECHS